MNNYRCIVLICLLGCLVGSAQSKTFSFGDRQVSCAEAVKYRDGQLFYEYIGAIDNFDSTREQRIGATIARFEADVASLTADIEKVDAMRQRRIAVAVAGLVLGSVAEKVSTVGVKNILTDIERKSLKIVAGRGAEWASIFIGYGVTGEIDVQSVAAMPMSLLLSFSPFAVAEKAWSLGSAGIDIATAVAESELLKGDLKLEAEVIRSRAKSLAKKLQMPRVIELNRIKNQIDMQCG